MMRTWYYWKAQATWTWAGMAGLLGFLLFLLLQDAFRPYMRPRTLAEVATVVELWLPLFLAMMVAPVPALEREQGTAELYLSYGHRPWLRLLEMLLIPVALWALALGVTALVADRVYLSPAAPAVAPAPAPAGSPAAIVQAELARVGVGGVVAIAIPPALALAGMALAGSALARHQVGGVLAAGLWWGIDLLVPAKINKWAYLFWTFRPSPDPEMVPTPGRLYLIAAASLLLMLWLSERRQRWIG